MAVDPHQPIPIYFQLKTLLLEEILGGRYGPDDRLPTEHELCEQLRISRTPVTRALSELAEEGRHPPAPPARARSSIRTGCAAGPISPRFGSSSRRRAVGEVIRDAAADAESRSTSSRFPLPSLHQMLTHAVAEGVAPDLAIIDSVWTRRVRRGRLPPRARGSRRAVDARRARGRLPRAARRRRTATAAAPSASPRSPTSPASGTAGASWSASASSRRATWAELRAVARAIADRTARRTRSSCPAGRRAARRRRTA